MRALVFIMAIVGGLLLASCQTMSYYGQAVRGQWSIWSQRESIESLLADADTDPDLKQRLALVLAIRDFASNELGLPDNGSYRYYADIHRPHVVWNVFAAPEFSVAPRQWCFPVAGCVSYRGYFAQQDAKDFAEELKHQGYDSYVGGVSAYSTLGWFDDPLLNTFIHRSDAQLAGLIFHELAHQQLYVAGDTTFNESFATAVEIEGVRHWLTHRGEPEAMASYLRNLRFRQDFVATMLELRETLDLLYKTAAPAPVMRVQKQETIEAFIANDYSAFKQRWDDASHYDAWVNSGLNNAKLSTLASYHQWVEAFQQLFIQSAQEWPAFYQRVAALAELDADQRGSQLKRLSAH